MSRDLLPLTVYLPPLAKEEAERRAEEKSLATATMLRLILTGHEPPLSAR